MLYDPKPSDTISDLITAFLLGARTGRHFEEIISDRKLNSYKADSVHVELSRMKTKGHLTRKSSRWSITEAGKIKYKRSQLFSYISSPFEESAPHNTILSFDIPETNRMLRNWLRNQLKIFGYKMLQQSLWIGHGPLPQNFLKRLVDLRIRKQVKIFKIKSLN